MSLIFLALGLVLIIEGLVYALAPHFIEHMLDALRKLSLDQRRALGLFCLGIGILLVWISRL